MIELWTQCHFDYQDGVLLMEAEEIEEMIDWSGPPGKFIEMATIDRYNFLDKINDQEYHLHNWYLRNPIFDPEKKKDDSGVKAKAANIRHFNDAVKVLKQNVPEEMDLGYKLFYSRHDFYVANTHKDKKKERALNTKHNRLIKQYTRRCNKCKTVCVSSTSICLDCAGE
jgi:hypothetical protein